MTRHRHPVIAFVSDAIYPYHRGGKELRYHELARRMAGRADVHVYTMRWWPGPRVRTEDAVTFHAISPLIPLYAGGRRSMRQAVFFALACLRLLGRRFDVLEADHMPYLQIFVLRLVATLRRKRFVVTWHEVWDAGYWRQYLGPAGRAAWFTQWLAMRLPDHIIAASPQTAGRLRAILGARASITVAPNGIDLAAVRGARPDPAATDLVVVSRLVEHKRIGMLLDAVALLRAQGAPVTCRVIGDGPERTALREQARTLGLDHAVEFRHDVAEQQEVYALMKAAKVFVFPSAREGFGISVLEALACGLDVVTTSDPDNLAQHLAERSARGMVCEPTAKAVAEATRRLLAAPGQRAGEDPSGTDAWLADYDWDTMTDRVAGAFGAGIAARRAAASPDDLALVP
jgi:glycosyltransferase involved in cell wall biosynthesis